MYLTDEFRLKIGLAEQLKGGVIMDVTNAEQALIAEKAGANAVMALERVPSDIRKEGGVARMAPISKIREIMATVSIPVMAKCRIGHFAEASILEALKVDYIDESEVLTMADDVHHVWKHPFSVPFVCGARNLGEALRRIAEGAAMIRTKGEAGSGNIVEACNSAPRRFSSARASSSRPIPNAAPGPSSRPQRTSTIRSNCWKPVRIWARRCLAWTSPRFRRTN